MTDKEKNPLTGKEYGDKEEKILGRKDVDKEDVVIGKPTVRDVKEIMVGPTVAVNKDIEELNSKIADCLKEHDYKESDIGVNHDYWKWQNQLKSLKG